MEYIKFGRPSIDYLEEKYVKEVLKSDWLGTGEKVKEFERVFADYKNVDPDVVVATSNCTSALMLSLLAAGVGEGDEVITTAMTFPATVNAILSVGATPVLCDIDIITMCIDPDEVKKAITKKTKAIIPVHFAGLYLDPEESLSYDGVKIIEDCAHCIEPALSGISGDYGCFSFYATKNITCGEGGMVICENAERASFIRRATNHGLTNNAWNRFSKSSPVTAEVVQQGMKCNMTDLNAAIGIAQLERINTFRRARVGIWEKYNYGLYGHLYDRPGIHLNNTKVTDNHALHLYTLLVDNRCEFIKYMDSKGIGCGIHYKSIADHKYYQDTLNIKPNGYFVAKSFGDTIVSLPLYPAMSEEDVSRVISAVISWGLNNG